MGIKVEVIAPSISVSEIPGPSRQITITRPSQSPISIGGPQSVIEVVKTVSVVNNAVISSTEPSEPFEGMIWIQVP